MIELHSAYAHGNAIFINPMNVVAVYVAGDRIGMPSGTMIETNKHYQDDAHEIVVREAPEIVASMVLDWIQTIHLGSTPSDPLWTRQVT